MKKVGLILVISLLILVSCRHRDAYDFLNSTEEIAGIYIVELSFDADGKLLEQETQKISDINTFLRDFKKVDCYTYYGDPAGVIPEGKQDTVIKISYKNFEYELINWNGQANYTNAKGFKFYAGFNVFDEEAFESLITKYSTD